MRMIKIKFNAQLANTTDSHPRRSIPISICNRDLARWHDVWNGRRQLAANLFHLFSAQFHAKRWTAIQNGNRCWLSSRSVTHFHAINAKNDTISFRWVRAVIAIGRFSLQMNHLNDCYFWWVEQLHASDAIWTEKIVCDLVIWVIGDVALEMKNNVLCNRIDIDLHDLPENRTDCTVFVCWAKWQKTHL